MSSLSKLMATLTGNGLGLLIAAIYVPGFNLPIKFGELFTAAFILTLINAFLRPLIKLIMGPLIVITFGLGIIAVNAVTLYLLSYFMPTVTISGLLPLFYATLIIGIINLFVTPFKKL